MRNRVAHSYVIAKGGKVFIHVPILADMRVRVAEWCGERFEPSKAVACGIEQGYTLSQLRGPRNDL